MKIHLLSATLVAALLAAGSSSSFAQGAPAASGRFGVAVIDIGRIFKEHVRFKQQMEQLKKQVEGVEEGLKKERDTITSLMEQQKGFNPGTPDYKAMDDKILGLQADFNLTATKKKKELMDKQDQLYKQVHQEIETMVASYCQHFGISIVLRHSADTNDQNDHNSVLRAINKPIVYMGPNMDITEEILTQLNRGATATVPSQPRPSGLPRRQ